MGLPFFKKKTEDEKKETRKEATKKSGKAGIYCNIASISGSGRQKHYGLYAGTHMVGDASGQIEVHQLAACDYLTAAEMRTIPYIEYPSGVSGKGLDREQILESHRKFKDLVSRTKEEKSATISDLQKNLIAPEKIKEETTNYDQTIKDMTEAFWRVQNRRKVTLNIGLMTAYAIRDSMIATPAEFFIPFGNATMDRLKKTGWKRKSEE